MALCEAVNVASIDFPNVALIDFAWRDKPISDEVSQPLGAIGVDFIVVRSPHLLIAGAQ
jgi:hypothetical protein